MERLTFEGNFCDIAQCRDSACKQDGTCTQKEVWKRLKAYEDTGLKPERCAEFARADAEGRYIVMRDAEHEGVARLRELAEADKDGRVVVLPCKVGERWVDEDGRAVRITAVIASMEPFGESINIYFDHEDATPDDAGSDCDGKIHYGACKEILKVVWDYDDNICYGYAGRSDCAMFRDFKAILQDCVDNKCDMVWN